MKCKACNQTLSIDVNVSGGCGGHPPDCYCYCDGPDVEVVAECSTWKCKLKSKRVIIPGLTDQYGLQRFLTKHVDLLTTVDW